jgi:hypothetical protein
MVERLAIDRITALEEDTDFYDGPQVLRFLEVWETGRP